MLFKKWKNKLDEMNLLVLIWGIIAVSLKNSFTWSIPNLCSDLGLTLVQIVTHGGFYLNEVFKFIIETNWIWFDS